jgi:hypothetical protein
MKFKIIFLEIYRRHTWNVLDLKVSIGLRIEELRNSLRMSREELGRVIK